MKKQHSIISLDMFPYDCLVTINNTPEQVQSILKRYGKILSEDMMEKLRQKKPDSAVFMFNSEHNTSLIFILADTPIRAMMLFDHEKTHLLHYLLGTFLSIPLCDQTEEVYAYAGEYLTGQFLKKLK